ncbi:MAG: hypothetical protein ABL958_11305 [Bdellovibrionia bacterium]
MNNFFSLRIRNFPLPVKALAAGYLMALALGYCYALANVVLVVGSTPKDIAKHYYGSDKKIEQPAATAGEESFDLNATTPSEPEIGPRPSLKNLVAEGHFHLFGMTSFFFGLTLLGLFTSFSDVPKAFLVGVPYFTIVIDNLSFMATRFLGPQFAFLTASAGGFMALSFAALWLAIFWEIIHPRSSK